MRRSIRVYSRVIRFLAPHKGAAFVLCGANLALAAAGFLEPVLFGRVIQSLGAADPTLHTMLSWAGIGLLGVAGGMATSLIADRLAHRLKFRVMGDAYAHVLQLPPAYHARYPNGAVTRVLWTGADE